MPMVCYTNHALDQFLEKVLDFLPTNKIIGLGGGCKSKALEPCSIKLFTKRCRRHGERYAIEQKISANNSKIDSFKDSIAKANKTLVEYEQLEERMDSKHTDQLYNDIFPPNVTNKCQTIDNTLKLWLCNNKELNKINQQASKKSEEVEKIEESIFFEQDMNEKQDSNLRCDAAATEIDVHGNDCKGEAAHDRPSSDRRPNAAEVGEETNGMNTLEGDKQVIFESGPRQSGRPVNLEAVHDSSSAEHRIIKADQQTFEDAISVELPPESLEAYNKDSNKDDRSSNADQDTITVDDEATIIQNQRLIEGDEEYMSEIPKQPVEESALQKNEVDVIDENRQRIEVTYSNQCQQFVLQNKENETVKGEGKGHQLPQINGTESEKDVPTKNTRQGNKEILLQTQAM